MNEDTTPSGTLRPARRTWVRDLVASSVVFLVAVPLCIGIAVACGAPAERGLFTGIVGGIVVGAISGAPLLVSGPAASLIVPVSSLIENYGLWALAPVVMLAGVWQAIAGACRLGQWFRAVAPAVILGMLIGIGILIVGSQFHVAIDAEPQASFLANVTTFPAALSARLLGPEPVAPVIIATATIGLIVGWTRLRPRSLTIIPGHLVALLAVTLATFALQPEVRYLDIASDFFGGLAVPATADFSILLDPAVFGLSFVFAFVASAATLLTANAIDERQTFSRANYDKEMFAQGIGNIIAGSAGGLPMTGVIVRSSTNVDAGARTRLSTVLHGAWILAFVVLAPQVLEAIPRASLGAILIYVGWRLIDLPGLTGLYRQGRAELGICVITILGIVFIDLFLGILAGLAASALKIVYTFARLVVRAEPSISDRVLHLHLSGSATFLQLPRLVKTLDSVPPDHELHLHIGRLEHIDHACLQLLSSWKRRRENEGRPGLVVQWSDLTARYRQARIGGGHEHEEGMLSLLWQEWKRLHAPREHAPAPEGPADDWLTPERIHLQADARTLTEVVDLAARMLAPATGRTEADIGEALRARLDGHMAIGHGVSVPHTPIVGVQDCVGAVVTTRRPIDVSGEPTDVFFVLLAPEGAPLRHLQALAHVGRLCHGGLLREQLRRTESPRQAAALLASARASFPSDSAVMRRGEVLVVLELDGGFRARRVARLVSNALGTRAAISGESGDTTSDLLRRVLRIRRSRRLVLVPIGQRDVGLVRALLDESSQLLPRKHGRLHILRPDTLTQEHTLEG